MSTEPSTSRPSKPSPLTARLAPALLLILVMGGGYWLVRSMDQKSGGSDESTANAATDESVSSNEINLPAGKIAAAEFTSSVVSMQQVQHEHHVPGRVQYDEARHIDIKAPMDGILSEVLVKPGDRVNNGQLLAVVSSPEIGQARAEVLKRQAHLQLVQRKLDRESTILQHLKEFLVMLDKGAEFDELDAAFSTRPLGVYRQELLSAYSQLRLTSDLNQNLRPLAGTGSVAERTIRERQAELQIARAEYRSVREKSAFDASQAEFQARADVADAERLLKIARQQLETLLGYPEPEVDMDSQPSLSRLELRAPFEGTIESRSMARSERVERGDPLFILADTTSLYIAADIRENDWPAISLQTGTKIEVSVPAIPDRTFTATVHYIGRQVVPETNAVPLVATINNVDGLLRPGMFVRVSLPLGPPRNALAVHPESVVQHEDQEFVFVAVTETSFRRADVTTGLTSDEWTEVTSGLTAGDHVIEHGAFLLKSELLLEGEE